MTTFHTYRSGKNASELGFNATPPPIPGLMACACTYVDMRGTCRITFEKKETSLVR